MKQVAVFALVAGLSSSATMMPQSAFAEYITVPKITQARTICHVYAWREPGQSPRVVRLRDGAPLATDSRCNPNAQIAYVAYPQGRTLHYRSRQWMATFALATDGTSLVSTWNKQIR